MNKRKIIIVGVCLMLMLSLGVSAVLLDFLTAKQDGYININGQPYLLFDGMIMNNLVIPLNITSMDAGDYIQQSHEIYNPGNQTFNVSATINNSWFDNSFHIYYGFTYGVKVRAGGGSWVELTQNSHTILYGNQSREFRFWYNVDENMITPMITSYVEPTIWINATVVE